MNKKVTTNLRVDESVYLQMKACAAGAGMSVNQYLNQIIRQADMKDYLGEVSKKNKSIYDALLKLATRDWKDKPMGRTEEDEVIYG